MVGPGRRRPHHRGSRPGRINGAGRTKAPEGTGGSPAVRRVQRLRTSPQSLVAAGSLARWPCDPRTRFPGPLRGSLPGSVWRFAPAPSGKTKCTGRGGTSTTGLSTNFESRGPTLSPTCGRCGRVVDTRRGGCRPMARLLARLVALNDRWAQPFGDFNHRWLSALFRPLGPVKDFLNGRWLGHPAARGGDRPPDRAAARDGRPRLLGQPAAADIALVATILTMLAAAVTGLADYTTTDGTARTRATTPRDPDGPRAPRAARVAGAARGRPGRPDHPRRPLGSSAC